MRDRGVGISGRILAGSYFPQQLPERGQIAWLWISILMFRIICLYADYVTQRETIDALRALGQAVEVIDVVGVTH